MKKHKRLIHYLSCASLVLTMQVKTAKAADKPAADLDGDGIPNLIDPDVDNDGLPNAIDPNVDGGIAQTGPFAGQYIGDHLDNDTPAEYDIDGDEQADDALGELDIDGDSENDDSPYETDIDGDGRPDDSLTELDIDGDGRLNSADLDDDTDGDGLDNDDPNEHNTNGNLLNNSEDPDDDHDGVNDEDDNDHHPEDDEMEVEIPLDRAPVAPHDAEAKAEVYYLGTGKLKLEVELSNVARGNYAILIDGVNRGTVKVREHEGKIEFENTPDDEGELLLDFEFFGLEIQITKDEIVYFSGALPEEP